MHLDPLTRLIESADFLAFREIAMKYLSLKGYKDVTLKDGWNDGGSDFAVGVLGENPTRLAIQITVQKSGWKKKARTDFRRAKAELGLTAGLYMTSRRLPQADFTKVAESLWEEDGITIRPVDSQDIASLFFEMGSAADVLTALGIPLNSRRPEPAPRPDLKEDAAYSFALFGDASDKFRNSVIEQTILSHLTRPSTDATREATIAAVSASLQLQADQVTLVASAIDRMLQQQHLQSADGALRVDPTVVKSFETMRSLRESQWQTLGRDVDAYLGSIGLKGSGLERASAAVLKGAGALFMGAATSLSAAVATQDPGPVRIQLKRRLREVAAALTASGVPEATIDRDLRELAELVSNSEIGRVLMAGELFTSLASMQTADFERALGGRGTFEIYLDASVAIPMLTALLYEAAEQRFSSAALGVYESATRRGLPLLLPDVYLEEAASHLIDAHDRYQPLLGDDDLRFSTNAFVAHFSDLTARGKVNVGFPQYAASFGYAPRTTTFTRQRDEVMRRMEAVLRRYSIEALDLPNPGAHVLTQAQEAVTFTANESNLARKGRLLEHDAHVIAYLMDSDDGRPALRVLCTWDQLHLKLRTLEAQAQASWQALDPAMLRDVLVLTRSEDHEQLMTTVDVAMELGDEESERGAAVLDGLIRIEKDALHDAQLLRLAQEFKNAYMQARRDDAAPDDFAQAWAEWKGGSRELVRQSTLPI